MVHPHLKSSHMISISPNLSSNYRQEGEWVWLWWLVWSNLTCANLCRTCWQLFRNQGLGKLQAEGPPLARSKPIKWAPASLRESRSIEEWLPIYYFFHHVYHHWSSLHSTATWFTTLWVTSDLNWLTDQNITWCRDTTVKGDSKKIS